MIRRHEIGKKVRKAETPIKSEDIHHLKTIIKQKTVNDSET